MRKAVAAAKGDWAFPIAFNCFLLSMVFESSGISLGEITQQFAESFGSPAIFSTNALYELSYFFIANNQNLFLL